jgi:hypothetical protein
MISLCEAECQSLFKCANFVSSLLLNSAFKSVKVKLSSNENGLISCFMPTST